MADHNPSQTSEDNVPNAEAETRRLKASMPNEWATYAEELAVSLKCSISSLAEAFLRAHKERPIEGLAIHVAKVEHRVGLAKEERGRAVIERNRAKRWPSKGSGEGGGFITAADGFLDEGDE